jgi:putative FmdB family regulatory protein
MPIFDYICKNCNHEFESLVLQRTECVPCPACGRDSEKKTVSLFTCTSVQLDKRLKMDSERQMKKGLKMMKTERSRKRRIKIL